MPTAVKLLHFADLHLGMENYGRPDPATGLSTRLGDYLRVFDAAIDCALEEQVDLVLFAGDAYRTRDPSPTHQREFATRIRRLSEHGIPAFLLAGNHDAPLSGVRANSVQIFDTLGVPNVIVAGRPGLYPVPTAHGTIQVVALPWMHRNWLFTKEEFRSMRLEELDQEVVTRIEQEVARRVAELDPSCPAVLVSHCSVIGAAFGAERNVMLGQDVQIPKSILTHSAFDYVALGHLHRHQVLGEHPLMVYSGSLERIDFSEEKETKGFVLVHVRDGETRHEFRLVPARPMVTIAVRAEGEDPTARIISAIGKHEIGEAIVRVRIDTSGERDAEIREDEIRRLLAGAFYQAGIIRRVEREAPLLVSAAHVEGLTMRQALELYLNTRGTTAERREQLLAYAEALIQELREGADS